MQPIIRFATQDDAQEILNIYAPYVLSSAVTFEPTVPRAYDFKRRITTVSATMPYLVCAVDGIIAGFAYATTVKGFAPYTWNTNLHVYIGEEYQRCNIASALYLAIISLLKAQGCRKVNAVIPSSNEVSEAFHSAFGFKKLATVEKAGYKLGKWHSVSIFEKTLDETDKPPVPIKSISEIDEDFCNRNFQKCSKIIKNVK